MIRRLFVKLHLFIKSCLAYLSGYFKGEEHEREKQIKRSIKDALKTQKRRDRRLRDNDRTVIKRMRRFTRDDQ